MLRTRHAVRTQYRRIRNSLAVQNLPPGVASDKDIAMVLEGFPSDFSNYEEMRKYISAMERAARKRSRPITSTSQIGCQKREPELGCLRRGRAIKRRCLVPRFPKSQSKRLSVQQTPTSELPIGIRRPDPDGAIKEMDDEIEAILKGYGL